MTTHGLRPNASKQFSVYRSLIACQVSIRIPARGGAAMSESRSRHERGRDGGGAGLAAAKFF